MPTRTRRTPEQWIACSARPHAPIRTRGYTLLELIIVLTLIGIVAGVAIAKYLGYVEKARVARAVSEILTISRSIDALVTEDASKLPDSLADVDAAHMLDPWGNPYQYLKLLGELPRGMSGQGAVLPPVAAPGGGGGGGPPGGGGGGSPGGGGGGPPDGGGGGPPDDKGGGPPDGKGGGPPDGKGGKPAIALARKDRFLVPINSDYDLYSMGADGESKPQLHNAVSRDDVIRARDGSYVGLAENF